MWQAECQVAKANRRPRAESYYFCQASSTLGRKGTIILLCFLFAPAFCRVRERTNVLPSLPKQTWFLLETTNYQSILQRVQVRQVTPLAGTAGTIKRVLHNHHQVPDSAAAGEVPGSVSSPFVLMLAIDCFRALVNASTTGRLSKTLQLWRVCFAVFRGDHCLFCESGQRQKLPHSF